MALAAGIPQLTKDFQSAINDIIEQTILATFMFGDAKNGFASKKAKVIAAKLSSQLAPKLATAIMSFVMNAQVQPSQLVAGTSSTGPVTGATTTVGTLI